MDTLMATLAVITGFMLRLAIPIAITAVAVYFLRRLDAHWQAEAESLLTVVQKPHCWETKNCTPEMRAICPGYSSQAPCWQALRNENGYLQEKCLGCDVFRNAPVPVQN